ncbi:MAG: PAS domain-containing protein, partial [Desulfobulbaceae bacterium]|nr:PAS domain-containing protein [Desulfobulbaceae bacterium]
MAKEEKIINDYKNEIEETYRGITYMINEIELDKEKITGILEKKVKQLQEELADTYRGVTQLTNELGLAVKALQNKSDNLTGILDSMEDGVYIVNRQYDIEYINPALEKEFGQTEGKKCYEYFQDRKEVCPWCKIQEVFKGKTVRWEWYSFKNKRTYDLIDTPLINPDGTISKLEIFRDVTEQKRAEEELKKHKENLEELIKGRTAELAVALERAQESDQLKSAFLASMSHELRTPLNSIIGFTGIILQGIVGELNDEQRKQLKIVYDSGKHLLRLINDVLDISKIEAGKIEIASSRFEVEGLIQTVEKMVSPMVEEKGLKLDISVSDGTPTTIYSDKNRIKQVLINLLSNAIKFTESGRIGLIVRPSMLEEDLSGIKAEGAASLVFSVSDTGIG